MGAFETGTTSGVTAGDLVSAPDIGKVAPGKTNTVQTFEIGEQFIDHGALCDGKDQNTAGCFLKDDQRKRLIGKFESRVLVAQGNYQHALAELRVDELMKKDDDLHWVLSLALDVAGAHILGVAARALKGVKAGGLAKLTEAGLDGRKLGHDRTIGYTSVRRDTRVIWVMNRPGTGKTLYYQSQEGAHDPSVVKPGDPGSAWAFPEHAATSHEFGPANPRETPQLGRRVPEEFLEAAIARSEQLWGPAETIDARDYLVSQGYDPDVTSGALQPAPVPDPADNRTMHAIFFGDDDAPPAPQPTPPQPAPLPKGSVFNKTPGGLPTDSVFAQQDQR